MQEFLETDEIDDEIPDFDHPEASRPRRDNATEALALMALEAALNSKIRAMLKRHPSVIVVEVPSSDWAAIIALAIKHMGRAPVVKTVTERLKQGAVLHRVGSYELKHVQQGRSVLYISQDPGELLDDAVLAAADVTITIPALTPVLLGKVIRSVTGRVARGVTADMAALDLAVITSVVRQELTAHQCVTNLKRAVMRKVQPPVSSGPLLHELPLTVAMREWADQTLSDLYAVKTGAIEPELLVFGVLEGPPGTGKTHIAESLARTAGWTFVSTNVGTLFTSGDGALGGVARNLKAFFDQVLSQEPAIGFMDEIESFPNRATMDSRGRDWWTPVVTLFLTEIDRVRQSGKRVLILGATNYYSRLDAALVRPGRLQQRISVLPSETEDEVIALLRYHLKDDLTGADLGKLGRVGRGATPAMVQGWLKQARSRARSQNRPLKPSDILDEIVPEDDRSAAEIRAIALHELGHAVVAHRLGQTVESISIIPEGPSGGRTWTKLSTVVPTWGSLLDIATVALGGRAADLVLGEGANAGAEGDLASATELLLAAHERQGLRDSLVFVPALGNRPTETFVAVNAELRRLLKRAQAIIEADRDLVLSLADRLIEERVLAGAEIAIALAGGCSAAAARPAGSKRPKAHTSNLVPR